ncbi:MAG: ABC transporter permease [Acidobacteria bacterium]|nr:ABC transporter permease [Acidobacteriota bacterium]MCW5968851.1 ABC transporter permease [Blastocatellales bacterium]
MKFRRMRRDEEIDAEIRHHLDEAIRDRIERGEAPDEARANALREFGNVGLVKEATREMWGWVWLEQLRQDLGFGLRMLRKNPGFAFVAILTLALGIGANTAILSVVNGLLLRPLPVEDPEQLLSPFWGSKKDAQVWGSFSYANYKDLREQNQSLAGLLAWRQVSAGISATGERHAETGRAERAYGELVSANYFDVLGVKPVLGRGFLPEEERTSNTHPVVVISESLWQERFQRKASVIGQTIYLNGSPFTVVGVAPTSFKGVAFAFRQAFWAPLMMSPKLSFGGDWNTNRTWNLFHLIGRRKPGVTMTQAEADLNLVAGSLAQQHPSTNAGTKVQVVPQPESNFSRFSKVLRLSSLMALSVSLLVLLVACANVANLLLARATTRTKEIGIRLALGAGRGRIVRQLLTESMLLALIGGVLGCLFAYWGAMAVQASFPPLPYPIDLDFSPDAYVLKWMIVTAMLTSIVFGLIPALAASRPDLVAIIKGDAAGQTRSRHRWNLRGSLVVAQMAISVIVLICAGLFLRSLNRAVHLDLGFSTENLMTMQLDPRLLDYDEAEVKRFFAEALRRIETLPGVRSASLAGSLPLGNHSDEQGPMTKEGEPDPLPNQGIQVASNFVAPKYFETLRTPLVLGRDFTERDTKDAPQVVIVNQEFARKFYGSAENALGKRIRLWSGQAALREIIGIAQDGLYWHLYEAPRPFLFLPEYQVYSSAMMLLVSVKPSGEMKAVAENVRQTIAQLDARMPVAGLMMAEANLSFAYWGARLAAGLSSTFGLLGLLLATTGLYSVMTYAVAQRTREIGIRLALGAQVRDVLRLIVTQGVRVTVLGLALGLLGAFALTRLLASLLLGIGATDPLTFIGVGSVLMSAALLACYLPARRATKVDPMIALRTE